MVPLMGVGNWVFALIGSGGAKNNIFQVFVCGLNLGLLFSESLCLFVQLLMY